MSIVWSFSGQKTFFQCPRQFYEVNLTKRVKSKGSAATEYGTAVHQAIEDYLLGKAPYPKEYERYFPFVDRVEKLNGKLFAEIPMGITIEGAPCEFDAPDVWWHGIPDVLVVNEDKGVAWVVDWKTSKSPKYADLEQLELLALATFAKYPKVNKVKGALMFLVCKEVVPKTFERKDFALILSKWIGKIDRIERSVEVNTWNPKPNSLCRFCPVTSCEYNDAA